MKRIVFLLVVSLISFIAVCNFWIIQKSEGLIFEETNQILGAEVGLVFGTSQYFVNGEPNSFFQNRVNAASELLKSGKVEKMILSGSKDSIYYNEARAMKAALIALNIDSARLILDANGNRTIQSLVRLKEVHGFKQCILVTQKYHAYRALFIADFFDIEASCYLADTPDEYKHNQILMRELLARTKAILDLYIFRLGDQKND